MSEPEHKKEAFKDFEKCTHIMRNFMFNRIDSLLGPHIGLGHCFTAEILDCNLKEYAAMCDRINKQYLIASDSIDYSKISRQATQLTEGSEYWLRMIKKIFGIDITSEMYFSEYQLCAKYKKTSFAACSSHVRSLVHYMTNMCIQYPDDEKTTKYVISCLQLTLQVYFDLCNQLVFNYVKLCGKVARELLTKELILYRDGVGVAYEAIDERLKIVVAGGRRNSFFFETDKGREDETHVPL